MFTTGSTVDRAAVRTLQRGIACPQVGSDLAAIPASVQRDRAAFRAARDDMKKVSSECVVLSAIVHLQRIFSFQMKVKNLKSH